VVGSIKAIPESDESWFRQWAASSNRHVTVRRWARGESLAKTMTKARSLLIVPLSFGGVWWAELDEGIELQPLLDLQPLI